MKISQKLALLFTLFFSFAAHADWASIASTDFSLDPPPAKGSKSFEEDFAVLLEYQNNRSQADCELSQSQQHPDFDSLYGSSRIMSATEMQVVQPFVDRTMNLMERISGYFKNKYKRPRPYSTDHRISPCVEPPTGAKSYPSSHAAMATIGACVLKEVFPNKASELKKYANYLAELRVIVGVHHPSDILAGKELANALCERLIGDDEFQGELKALQRNF